MEYKPIHLENSKSCVIHVCGLKTKWLTVALATKRHKSLGQQCKNLMLSLLRGVTALIVTNL